MNDSVQQPDKFTFRNFTEETKNKFFILKIVHIKKKNCHFNVQLSVYLNTYLVIYISLDFY